MPLYRKYRPQQLEEVVGQEHIKKALTNAITTNKISHAYLFTGPRGTGKTSTARIFAKSLNCVEGPTIHPCGKCGNCIDITNSTPMDVIEIDAASNRSVEDAQHILERVMYAPVNSRYKIYIIDEVHMLSTTAFNALLKTLEEPPKNVIFILATTEVHKVLDTIKSRCQRYDFRRITTEDIVAHLRKISDLEGINITEEALISIAKNSAGGMRDSIALLEQLSVLGGEITTAEIDNLLGRLSFDLLNEFSQKIVESKPNEAITILEKVYNSGNEPVQILTNLLDYFRNLLVVKTCSTEIAIELSQLNELQIEALSKQATSLDAHQIVFLVNKCAEYIKELKTTNNPKLWLEVAVIDLANLAQNTTLMELQERITRLEAGGVSSANIQTSASVQPARTAPPKPVSTEVPQQPKAVSTPPQAAPAKEEKVVQEFSPMPAPAPSAPVGSDLASLWGQLLECVTSAPTRALLKQWSNPIEISPDGVILSVKNEIFLKQFTDGAKRDVLQTAINTMFGKEVELTVRLPKAGEPTVSPRLSSTTSSAQSAPSVAVPEKSSTPVHETKAEEATTSEKPAAKPLPEPQEENEIEEESIDEAEKEVSLTSYNAHSEEYYMHSDTVNMALEVFGGKIIE